MKKELSNLHKYLMWGVIAVLLILSYLIIKPFIISLISAFILSYLLKPLHRKLESKMRPGIASLICIVITILIIIIPLGLIIGTVVQQAYSALQDTSLNSILTSISHIPLFSSFNINLELVRQNAIIFFIGLLTNTANYLPNAILSIAITVFSMFYMLINWDNLAKHLEHYIPFENKKSAVNEISKVTRSIVYGTVIIALIQSIIALIAFWLLKVPNYLLMSALVFFLGFIPSIGPAVVWIPFFIYYLIIGSYAQAIGIGIIGLILSIGIDTLLRTKILGKESKINPVLMLVSVLGGVALFGIFGFIIGPLVLVYTLKLLEQAIENSQ